jgi:uncharacterized membrane protein (UPF0127 family)
VKRRGFIVTLALVAALPSVTAQAPEWAVAIFPSGTEFSLEIAAEPNKRALGYMFREHVGPNEGMLFIFEVAERHGIWMKNCKVALDIIWLDEQLRVVEIASNRQPCPEQGECSSVAPFRPARFVLEVAGGVTAKEGLEPGDTVIVLSEPALR